VVCEWLGVLVFIEWLCCWVEEVVDDYVEDCSCWFEIDVVVV